MCVGVDRLLLEGIKAFYEDARVHRGLSDSLRIGMGVRRVCGITSCLI